VTPSLAELHALAAARGVPRYRTLPKAELLALLEAGPPEAAAAIVEPPAARPDAREPDAPQPDAPQPDARQPDAPPGRPADPVARVERDGPLALVTLDDPGTRNAVGTALLASLDAACLSLADDPGVRLVAITGAGTVFSSGALIREHDDAPDGGERLTDGANAVLDRLAALPVPVVALVNGHAVGGGAELALAADWRLVAPQAELRFVHVGFGLVPGFGGLARLARLVGPSAALHLLATRATVDGRRAVALGLALDCPPAHLLVQRALELAQAIAESDRDAVRTIKRALSNAPALDRGREREAFLDAWPNRKLPPGLGA
jgi:enoyl-CoA hydratase/carnithine racemase